MGIGVAVIDCDRPKFLIPNPEFLCYHTPLNYYSYGSIIIELYKLLDLSKILKLNFKSVPIEIYSALKPELRNYRQAVCREQYARSLRDLEPEHGDCVPLKAAFNLLVNILSSERAFLVSVLQFK